MCTYHNDSIYVIYSNFSNKIDYKNKLLKKVKTTDKYIQYILSNIIEYIYLTLDNVSRKKY